jgi:ketosteroid isomerase-like protein
MYHAFVRRRVRHGFQLVSSGQIDAVVAQFADDAVFAFPGEHAMAGERRGHAAIRDWFEETRRLFPDFRLVAKTIIVEGGPWRTRVGTRFEVFATFPDGSPYRNEGMQFLEIRWGRIRQDRLFEDTQIVADALKRVRATKTAAPA